MCGKVVLQFQASDIKYLAKRREIAGAVSSSQLTEGRMENPGALLFLRDIHLLPNSFIEPRAVI